ncbi:hypothetical protein ACWD6U_00215 [Streptomyces sp. NPDC005149]
MRQARAKKLTDQDRRGLTALFWSDISPQPLLLHPARRAGLRPLRNPHSDDEPEDGEEA